MLNPEKIYKLAKEAIRNCENAIDLTEYKSYSYDSVKDMYNSGTFDTGARCL